LVFVAKTARLLPAWALGSQVLLELGADAGLRDNKGRLAVHFAAERGQTAALRILVAGPEDVQAMDRSGDTALHVAASRGHVQVCAGCCRQHTAMKKLRIVS
jgi:ankyrin repeat protein